MEKSQKIVYSNARKPTQVKAVEDLKKAEEMFRERSMDYYLAKTREVLSRE